MENNNNEQSSTKHWRFVAYLEPQFFTRHSLRLRWLGPNNEEEERFYANLTLALDDIRWKNMGSLVDTNNGNVYWPLPLGMKM
jgi:hypothetical protein